MAVSSSSPPLLLALRDYTAELHPALERTPVMARIGAADMSTVDLARSMSVLLQGFGVIEPQLDGEAWYRPQLPAIAADLARLPPVPLPVAESFVLADEGARLGAAYVLTGSRLGARGISRMLRARFGDAFADGLEYYGNEGRHSAEQWQSLLRRLQDAGTAEPLRRAAGHTAQAVFAMLIRLAGGEPPVPAR